MKATILMTSAGVCALSTSLAFAQDIDTIIVTAQKREESLQDVPVAVTAIAGDELDQELIRDFRDVQFSVPNLHISQEQQDVQYTIRGIASSTSGATAFHRDGVFMNNVAAGSGELYDLERLEVLRGPQGTLFGRNSTAGAINAISARAKDSFTIGGDVQVGNFDLFRSRGHVNVPLSESVFFRVAYNYAERDGFQENLVQPGAEDDLDDLNEWSVRPQLVFEPNDQFEVQLIGEWYESQPNGTSVTPLVSSSQLFDVPLDLSGVVPGLVIPNIFAAAGASGIPDDPRQAFVDTPPGFGVDYSRRSFRGQASYSMPDFLGGSFAKVVFGQMEFDYDRTFDIDGTDAQLASAQNLGEGDEWSVEFQLGSENDSPLQWLVGAYHLSADVEGYIPINLSFNDASGEPLEFFLPAGVLAPVPVDVFPLLRGEGGNRTDANELRSYAIFGQLDYDLTDRLSLTAGLRYTEDQQDVTFSRVGYPLAPPLEPTSASETFDAVTGRLGAEFEMTAENLLYFTASRGFNSGGFNAGFGGPEAVDPEFVWSYEFGSKNFFLDRTLQLNLAAFVSDYTDLIITQVVEATSLSDTGDASVFGVEAEFVWRPFRSLQFDGFYAYLDTELENFEYTDPDTLQTVTLDGNALPRAPENQFALGAEYTIELGEYGAFRPRIDFYWQDEIFFRPDNRPDLAADSFSKTDVTFRWFSVNERYFVEAFVENIEDEQQVERINTGFAQLGSLPLAVYSPPRSYGIRAGFNF